MAITTERFWPPPALDPAGPFAAPLSEAAVMLFAIGGAVFLVVAIALMLALFGPAPARRLLANQRTLVVGGFAFPVVVLSSILVWGLILTNAVTAAPRADELRLRVTGEMWWWRVAYLDGAPFETANEIRIPAGRPVTLELESADVIHSFWVPRLARKLDMIPGRRNVLRLQADAPGVYRGQCTEYCGSAHALMAFEVVVMAPSGYAAWRQRVAATTAPSALRGAALFDSSGCGVCHAVRGTQANGLYGPDLTHVASRRTLAAGILQNDPATLRRWIRNAGAMKPGARMPSYETLPAEDLEAIALYVEDLV